MTYYIVVWWCNERIGEWGVMRRGSVINLEFMVMMKNTSALRTHGRARRIAAQGDAHDAGRRGRSCRHSDTRRWVYLVYQVQCISGQQMEQNSEGKREGG